LASIWQKATPEEKKQYQPILKTKVLNLNKEHKERMMKLVPELQELTMD